MCVRVVVRLPQRHFFRTLTHCSSAFYPKPSMQKCHPKKLKKIRGYVRNLKKIIRGSKVLWAIAIMINPPWIVSQSSLSLAPLVLYKRVIKDYISLAKRPIVFCKLCTKTPYLLEYYNNGCQKQFSSAS